MLQPVSSTVLLRAAVVAILYCTVLYHRSDLDSVQQCCHDDPKQRGQEHCRMSLLGP